LVIGGTTGEGSTLSMDEYRKLIIESKRIINGRIPIIAGSGSNNIATAIEKSKIASDLGVDGVLVVTPYYNKTTQAGLIKSYSAICDVIDCPLILYNVPSRTGCNIAPETVCELSKNKKIVAIKEASGDISQVAKIANQVDEKMTIYSGNDDQILPVMSLGGKGVISVLSNILPKETVDLVHSYLDNDIERSLKLQLKYLDLINVLFCEVNPIPVKCAMAHKGFGSNNLRLPLVPMSYENEKKMLEIMRAVDAL